jgi:eukaryotic-like serine/threonine-protein kinase
VGSVARLRAAGGSLDGSCLGGRYLALHCIGKGGMARVYLGRDTWTGRFVAIKALAPALADDVAAHARFRREMRVARAVRHPHIVKVLDVGSDYLVMELLRGADLAWIVARDGALPVALAVSLALQLCDALGAVHAAGIVHRDLKPENIFLSAGQVGAPFAKLLDFGISRPREASALTETGTLVGTPHYMAPEQIDDPAAVGPQTDMHALGAVLYFALTGQPPFEAATLTRLLIRIATDPAPCPQQSRSDVPDVLAQIVQRALAKRPEDRFQDVAAMRAALAASLAV